MADVHPSASAEAARPRFLFPELFKSFQVAVDPKKLVLAAGGLLALWLGWWTLSALFSALYTAPGTTSAAYSVERQRSIDPSLNDDQAREKGQALYQADLAQYQHFYHYAGAGVSNDAFEWKRPTGVYRSLPWNEDRGPNPYLLATGQYGRPWGDGKLVEWLLTEQIPFVLEPLRKFLQPVVLLFDARTNAWTRLYFASLIIWTLVVWGFFGGAISRLAVLQFAGYDRANLLDSVRFVLSRYSSYLSAPLVPLAFLGIITLLMILFGLFHLIPLVGDLLDAILWPLMLLLGFGAALLIVGLVGYPLMYATVSAEGGDTFDAVSRAFRYVYESPWNFLWYSGVAIAYGAVVIFFVGFIGSLTVHLSKWGVAQTPWVQSSGRSPEYLMIYAPTSYGWRELLTKGSPLATDVRGVEIDKPAADAYRATFKGWNYVGAFMVSLWVTLVLLAVVGFAYSYFFTASSMIYLLLRRKVDDTDMDEFYPDDEQFDEPLLPPMPPGPAAATSKGTVMVDAPTLRVPTPPAPTPTPAPVPVPATVVATSEPVVVTSTPIEPKTEAGPPDSPPAS